MIKELYPNKIEIIEKGDISIVSIIAKGFGKRGPIIHNFTKDNLENIFSIPLDIDRNDYINELGVCQIINNDCYIIYKIQINLDEYLKNSELVLSYIEPIIQDNNLELADYIKQYLKTLRKHRITDTNYIYTKKEMTPNEYGEYVEISDKIMYYLKSKFPELSYDELYNLIKSFDKLFDILKDNNVDFILSKLK